MKTTKIAKQMIKGLDFGIRYDILGGRVSIKKMLASNDEDSYRLSRLMADVEHSRLMGYTDCMREAGVIDADEMEAINRQCQHMLWVD